MLWRDFLLGCYKALAPWYIHNGLLTIAGLHIHSSCVHTYIPCVPKSEPLNILQQIKFSNKILHTQDDICYEHYYIVSYKSALTLLKYEFLNNITTASFAVCRPGRINLL